MDNDNDSRGKELFNLRCPHGRWLPENALICFVGLHAYDIIEVRVRPIAGELDLLGLPSQAAARENGSIVQMLGLFEENGLYQNSFQDEENNALVVAGMGVEVIMAHLVAPGSKSGAWERTWVKVLLSTLKFSARKSFPQCKKYLLFSLFFFDNLFKIYHYLRDFYLGLVDHKCF